MSQKDLFAITEMSKKMEEQAKKVFGLEVGLFSKMDEEGFGEDFDQNIKDALSNVSKLMGPFGSIFNKFDYN